MKQLISSKILMALTWTAISFGIHYAAPMYAEVNHQWMVNSQQYSWGDVYYVMDPYTGKISYVFSPNAFPNNNYVQQPKETLYEKQQRMLQQYYG